MFTKYYLVELIASNGMHTIHSTGIVKARLFQKPPIELCYKNIKQQGYNLINVACVVQVSKKSAEYLMEHIKSTSAPVSSLEKAVNKIKEQINKSTEEYQELEEHSPEEMPIKHQGEA